MLQNFCTSAKKTSIKICIAGVKPNINLICEVIKGPKKLKGKDRGFGLPYISHSCQ